MALEEVKKMTHRLCGLWAFSTVRHGRIIVNERHLPDTVRPLDEEIGFPANSSEPAQQYM